MDGTFKWLAAAGIALAWSAEKLRVAGVFRLDINCLMLLACIGALAIGEYTEGAAVVVLFRFLIGSRRDRRPRSDRPSLRS